MGLLEAATGLGFLFGPLIGSGLYSIGGYLLSFYGLSAIYIVFLPLIIYVAGLVEEKEKTMAAMAAELESDRE